MAIKPIHFASLALMPAGNFFDRKVRVSLVGNNKDTLVLMSQKGERVFEKKNIPVISEYSDPGSGVYDNIRASLQNHQNHVPFVTFLLKVMGQLNNQDKQRVPIPHVSYILKHDFPNIKVDVINAHEQAVTIDMKVGKSGGFPVSGLKSFFHPTPPRVGLLPT